MANGRRGARSADKPTNPFAGLRAQLRGTSQATNEPQALAKRIRHTLRQAAADGAGQVADAADLELFRKAAGKVCAASFNANKHHFLASGVAF